MPLAEDAERYEIDILNAGAVVRTLASQQPSILYPLPRRLPISARRNPRSRSRVVQMSAVGRARLRTRSSRFPSAE